MAHLVAAMALTGFGQGRLVRSAAVLVVAVLALFPAYACGTGGTGESSEDTVTGHVVDVSARSLLEIDVLTIEDDDGAEWSFSGRGYGGVTPSHLRQHMLQAIQIMVTYRDEGNVLLIQGIRDYTPGGTPTPHE